MLTELEIENYQSLRKLALHLGKLTVVTGATSSGKSAVIRAVRLLAFNARGTSYISHGATGCSVRIAEVPERWGVGIDRGGRGKDAYHVSTLDQPGGEVAVKTYTKLGGAVPEDVARLLALGDINFASQFDAPYLLRDSGGEVARILGRLTNVTLVFSAAREANRRRLAIQGDLRRAEEQLNVLTGQAQQYAGLRQRLETVTAAEAAFDGVQQRSAALTRLRSLTLRLSGAEEALARIRVPQVPSPDDLTALAAQLGRARMLAARLETAQDALHRAAVPEVPALDTAVELQQRLGRARSLLAAVADGLRARDAARAAAGGRTRDISDLETRLHDALVRAGTCPTCGQGIDGTCAH